VPTSRGFKLAPVGANSFANAVVQTPNLYRLQRLFRE